MTKLTLDTRRSFIKRRHMNNSIKRVAFLLLYLYYALDCDSCLCDCYVSCKGYKMRTEHFANKCTLTLIVIMCADVFRISNLLGELYFEKTA
jgi:hypothetical protein